MRVRTATRKDGSKVVCLYDDRGNYNGDIVVTESVVQVIMDDTKTAIVTPMFGHAQVSVKGTLERVNIDFNDEARKVVEKDYNFVSKDYPPE